MHGASSGDATVVDPAEARARGVDVLGIGQTLPLGRAAGAHAAIESRTALGKTLLLI